MLVTQMVRCPDCGSMAQRHFHLGIQSPGSAEGSVDTSQVTARTECSDCDYVLEICMTTGQVLASHIAPLWHPRKLAPFSPSDTRMAPII